MTDWPELDDELEAWRRCGRGATFWWRDDDAASWTPALDRLLEMRARHGVPLALSVIPASADSSLAKSVRGRDGVTVLQHGYEHANRAAPGEPECELASHLPAASVMEELREGWRRLAGLFPDTAMPIMVPPWNRIAPALVPLLPSAGFTGLSTFGARSAAEAAPGLIQSNVHVELIDWRPKPGFLGWGLVADRLWRQERGVRFRGRRGFVGPAGTLRQIVEHLAARRQGLADIDEPTGLMTHHAHCDAECWDFVDAFLSRTRAAPSVRWLSAGEVFAQSLSL